MIFRGGAVKEKSKSLNLSILLVVGMVLGGFIGHHLGEYPLLSWLNYGNEIGFDPPFALELGIINFVLGITININISSILGMGLGFLVYRQM